MNYLKVGICDDDELILDKIHQLVCDQFKQFDCVFKMLKFSNAKSLVDSNCIENFDIVFLDIDMPEFNGIDAAKSIKYQNPNTVLIFITSKDDLVFESLKAQPFRFIRKSKLKDEITEAVLEAYKLFDKNSYKLILKIENKDYEIDVNSILFIESNKNYIIINTINHREIKYRDSINKKEKELEGHGFIRTHFGYLINQKYIQRIQGDFVVINDNLKIPVSRSRKQFVKQRLLEYLR
jgi:DNA-binding LytR/AlgR family response regulator